MFLVESFLHIDCEKVNQGSFDFVAVISPYKFSICDTTPECFTKYEGGGIVCQVKVPKIVQFVSIVNLYFD